MGDYLVPLHHNPNNFNGTIHAKGVSKGTNT